MKNHDFLAFWPVVMDLIHQKSMNFCWPKSWKMFGCLDPQNSFLNVICFESTFWKSCSFTSSESSTILHAAVPMAQKPKFVVLNSYFHQSLHIIGQAQMRHVRGTGGVHLSAPPIIRSSTFSSNHCWVIPDDEFRFQKILGSGRLTLSIFKGRGS